MSMGPFCDPIQPNPSADWPNQTDYKWKTLDPARLNTYTQVWMYELYIIVFCSDL